MCSSFNRSYLNEVIEKAVHRTAFVNIKMKAGSDPSGLGFARHGEHEFGTLFLAGDSLNCFELVCRILGDDASFSFGELGASFGFDDFLSGDCSLCENNEFVLAHFEEAALYEVLA